MQLQPPQPQAPQFTDTELSVVQKYAPSQYSQPHWSQQSKFNTGPKGTNEQIVQSVAAYAQSRFVQERAIRGLATSAEDLTQFRDSAAYRQALEVAAPPDEGGLPSADSIVEDIRKTSKYGRDFTGKDYNRELRRAAKLNKLGEYDR